MVALLPPINLIPSNVGQTISYPLPANSLNTNSPFQSEVIGTYGYIRFINYSPYVLTISTPSHDAQYVGAFDETYVSINTNDDHFSYTIIAMLQGEAGLQPINPAGPPNAPVYLSYYAPGEALPIARKIGPSNNGLVPFAAHLGSGNISVSVPANGASVNLGLSYAIHTGVTYTPYILGVVMQWNGQGAGAGGINWELAIDLQDNTNTSVGGSFPAPFFRYNNDWPAIAGPYSGLIYNWPRPKYLALTTPSGTADHFALIMTTVAKTNAPAGVVFNIEADVYVGAPQTTNI